MVPLALMKTYKNATDLPDTGSNCGMVRYDDLSSIHSNKRQKWSEIVVSMDNDYEYHENGCIYYRILYKAHRFSYILPFPFLATL